MAAVGAALQMRLPPAGEGYGAAPPVQLQPGDWLLVEFASGPGVPRERALLWPVFQVSAAGASDDWVISTPEGRGYLEGIHDWSRLINPCF